MPHPLTRRDHYNMSLGQMCAQCYIFVYVCVWLTARLGSPATCACEWTVIVERQTHSQGKHWLEGFQSRNGFDDNYISSAPPFFFDCSNFSPVPPLCNKFSSPPALFHELFLRDYRFWKECIGYICFIFLITQSTDRQRECARRHNEAQVMQLISHFWWTGEYIWLTALWGTEETRSLIKNMIPLFYNLTSAWSVCVCWVLIA